MYTVSSGRIVELDSDPEMERYRQRLLEERALLPDQRMKRILARLHELCSAKKEMRSDIVLLPLFPGRRAVATEIRAKRA
jgi:hypothetical protein